MISLADTVRRARRTACRRAGTSTIIMVIREKRVLKIGGVGARICEIAESPVTVSAIRDRIVAEYDVSPERARTDVTGFVTDLVAKHVLELVGNNSSTPPRPRPHNPAAPSPGDLENNPVFIEAMRTQSAAGRPWLATFEVTNRCNLNCRHCYIVEGRMKKSDRQELTREEVSGIFDQLRELGVFALTLTGGEFFAHHNAFAYLEEATRRAFAIRLFSGLTKLPASELDRLLDYNVFVVETSVHGADAATHDAFTKHPGSFDSMIASVRRLLSLGIPVVMKTCWTKYNWRQYADVVGMCANLGATFRGTCYIQSRNDGSRDNLDVRMNDQELYEFTCAMYRHRGGPEAEYGLTELARANPDGDPCGVGRVSLRIDPYGTVFPCVEMQTPAGNLKEERLSEIWEKSQALGAARAVRNRDFDLNDTTGYDPENGSCILCMAANLKEKGSLTLVAEEAKRISRIMSRAKKDYLTKR